MSARPANLAQTNPTDSQLVALARQGDREAFGALAQRHWQLCVNIGCQFLRNRDDAEDQAQNAALKAYRCLDQYRGEVQFSTWLGRIVQNECLMLMRSRRQAVFVYLDETPSHVKPLRTQLPAADPDPERAFAYLEFNRILKSRVKGLRPFSREVIELRYFQGMFPRAIAQALGISVVAARSRLDYAHGKLRVRMEVLCSSQEKSTCEEGHK